MVIDCHAHVTAPQKLWAYRALLTANRGVDGPGKLVISDDEIEESLHIDEIGIKGHLELLTDHKIDLQLISPRPYHLMHSEYPEKMIRWFLEEEHNVMARIIRMHPDKFQGIAALPQCAGLSIKNSLPELERAVKELGFRGCLINPDPFEERGTGEAPSLGDEYWYPLYEMLCKLKIPGIIHATTSCSSRLGYSIKMINEESIGILNLLNSNVFQDFPDLKLIIPHGGGAIPYQIGRFEADYRKKEKGSFREHMKKFYYDTVLYSEEAIEFLIKVVGADNCLFGTECPGVGAVINPCTGKQMDDLVPVIDNLSFLSEDEKKKIFEENAKKVFGI